MTEKSINGKSNVGKTIYIFCRAYTAGKKVEKFLIAFLTARVMDAMNKFAVYCTGCNDKISQCKNLKDIL